MQLDDFECYMQAKRREARMAQVSFWREYAWTLVAVVGWGALSVLCMAGGPAIHHFLAG